MFEKFPKVDQDFYERKMIRYAFRSSPVDELDVQVNMVKVVESKAAHLGKGKALEVLFSAPDDGEWLNKLSYWSVYYFVGERLNFFWHHRFRIIFPDRGLNLFSMTSVSQMMAICAMLGWKEQAIYLGYMAHAGLNRNYKLTLQYREEHRRAQAFMLRLFSDWVGDVSHEWPSYGYDEPIYEALLANWRNPDPEALVPCLLAACDRHTHQAGGGGSKVFYDFDSENFLQRTPIEILFIFRLREWEGLENPVLDHPLMAAPFDRLPPVQPVPEIPELLQAVLKRAREDWPQFDEVVSLEALKAPPSRV
ncbi:hypothetical protein [Amphibiibacter pelophylacis]|uniref:Uncharacterized protein n=1 Tax=Amphibiibacter pelophylacis TaxID=1799477 RepID=A0ACC6P4R3_9BURK